ncbi:hypothetical protein RLOC_00003696 [Lonchura striata]|uniref:Uncharacterized protein n=1 Tax=Lonchura striata TaxID=40157 RepID=A0A218VDU9_9PASE|nr:hypothetical protein RLOC_00003696 [Lonchura striata domestica]
MDVGRNCTLCSCPAEVGIRPRHLAERVPREPASPLVGSFQELEAKEPQNIAVSVNGSALFLIRTNRLFFFFFFQVILCLQSVADASAGWWHPQRTLKAAETQQWQMGRNYKAIPRETGA